MSVISVQYFDAPCGRLILGGYENKFCLCGWMDDRRRSRIDARVRKLLKSEFVLQTSDVLSRAMLELEEYFNGGRVAFDIPLLMLGTDFQRQTWQCLCTIPYGTTISYGEEANRMGRATAVRAVANANGNNSLAIFVPCHRVINSGGALGGYSGGLDIKRYLLGLERSEF